MPSHADRVRRNYDLDDPGPPRAETDPSKSPIDDDADAGGENSDDAPDETSDETVPVHVESRFHDAESKVIGERMTSPTALGTALPGARLQSGDDGCRA